MKGRDLLIKNSMRFDFPPHRHQRQGRAEGAHLNQAFFEKGGRLSRQVASAGLREPNLPLHGPHRHQPGIVFYRQLANSFKGAASPSMLKMESVTIRRRTFDELSGASISIDNISSK